MAVKRMKIVVSVRIVKICESLEDQDVKKKGCVLRKCKYVNLH